MNKQELLQAYKKQEDKICLSQILDKKEMSQKKGALESTDFLDMYQVALVKNFLKKNKFENTELCGGYEQAERKIAVFFTEQEDVKQDKLLKIVRITLPEEEKGKYAHRNYLGAIVKLGLKREKVGDIIVYNEGADIIVVNDFANILKEQLPSLTRFEKSIIEIKDINELKIQETKKEEIKIIVSSMRLDNIVADLAKTSRSKAVDIIKQERVFINGQNEAKVSKQLKLNDVLTIRGKGRFVIKELAGNTRSGRPVLVVEKYV